ncbi:TetR/AcrR family transcriptional regulator [Paenibacillus durus]|uniref:HTH tetR-type domain-containing protein n=1 Tax=Paenibacillus durus ATCC 35681 TaxID=1333534 RepID=A0A0F7F6M7_PAEDU|nr:TetR family transcriptional regulator [Paenibacillus durus]AKG33364.1 hypothetical protein VK70_01020 [Paenibacillus durus ATCC 35681]
MESQRKRIDRRSRRSQQLLKQSFMELMREKGFTAMTIQDITDRADVNRGTFYAHFPDKYALLELSIREKFRSLLDDKLPSASVWDNNNLRILIHAVLEHFRSLYGRCSPVDTVNQLFERTVQEELAALLSRWLEQLQASQAEWKVPIETMALMISWSIFGAAAQWSRGKSGFTVEKVTDHVLVMITEGAARIARIDLLD